ncbi:MAG: enoyl-CoA hydratase/isomerase family protein [Bacteroidetes bacterium]|nr:enoyl-CoA hydratase/isomerase family protein [Bacteroidota bacterium]MBU2586178.1 enoyl-CoA hydratase/isomerase family protein [Bacteroidota bacterium]
MYSTLLFDPSTDGNNRIAKVTVNRPDKLNLLNSTVMNELKELFEKLKDDDSVDVVILTGSGEKAFVAGADIKELNALEAKSGKDFSAKGQEVFNLIENLGKPVIAAVNGFALGGGCEIALACHMRVASENAKFGQPEVNLGIIPGYGGTQRLARLIGKGRAMEMILTGDMIDAKTAYDFGLVNKVVPQAELIKTVEELATKILSKGQIAVRMSVKTINATHEMGQAEGQKYEAELFGYCCGTKDFKEGTTAFLEKRKAEFKGE